MPANEYKNVRSYPMGLKKPPVRHQDLTQSSSMLSDEYKEKVETIWSTHFSRSRPLEDLRAQFQVRAQIDAFNILYNKTQKASLSLELAVRFEVSVLGSREQYKALMLLLPYYNDTTWDAVSAALQFKESSQCHALELLLPRFANVGDAVSAALKFEKFSQRKALALLLPKFSNVDEAVSAALKFKMYDQCGALELLLPRFANVGDAVSAAMEFKKLSQCGALELLLPEFANVREAVSAALKFEKFSQRKALALLLPKFSNVDEAVSAALKINNESQNEALKLLLPRFTNADEAVSNALKIKEYSQYKALKAETAEEIEDVDTEAQEAENESGDASQAGDSLDDNVPELPSSGLNLLGIFGLGGASVNIEDMVMPLITYTMDAISKPKEELDIEGLEGRKDEIELNSVGEVVRVEYDYTELNTTYTGEASEYDTATVLAY